MEDDSLNSLLISVLAIPFVIGIQVWIKERRDRRRNSDGDQEFKTTREALVSFFIEGLAVVGGLAVLIAATSGIAKYIINVYG